jgi:hypothetical protein
MCCSLTAAMTVLFNLDNEKTQLLFEVRDTQAGGLQGASHYLAYKMRISECNN